MKNRAMRVVVVAMMTVLCWGFERLVAWFLLKGRVGFGCWGVLVVLWFGLREVPGTREGGEG